VTDFTPGNVVEFDDELYLIEDVKIELLMQKIEPLLPMLERQQAKHEAGDYSASEIHNPVWTKLTGSMTDPHLTQPRMRVLIPEGEPE
jgi:hypothetical protein